MTPVQMRGVACVWRAINSLSHSEPEMYTLRPRKLFALLTCLSFFASLAHLAPAQRSSAGKGGDVRLADLSNGQIVNGFRAVAVYLNDADQPMGGRFVHQQTGFTLDLLQIQSVPQAFIWVNTFPTSDMGEPHTQEHLLVGKGNKGRGVSGMETMSLVTSNAFTMQRKTAYDFNTAAGSEVFYQQFERQMDALLHPDYTDEEIRREVRNFGVTENPADKTLGLEEKGSVYNEMVSSYSQANTRLFHELSLTLYGAHHPLSYESGGLPSGIREMKPEDIRRYHDANYHLANMGMIGSFPKEMRLGDILARTGAILSKLEPTRPRIKFNTEADLPAPHPAPAGKIEFVEFPHKNDQQPGIMVFAWPATLDLDPMEQTLLSLFLDNVASDSTSNLYKRFVDTKTRELDLGAKSVFNFVGDDEGHPVYVGLFDVATANMNEQTAALVRQKVLDEFKRVAAFGDGSPELAEFNARLKNRVIEAKRGLSKFVNSPPGFGFRNTGSEWLSQLELLNRTKDFKKSVTLKPDLTKIETLLDPKQNVWRNYVSRWHLADTVPYAAGARPNPKLVQQEEQERRDRSAAEIARLKAKYNVADEQESVRRYKADYDAASAELDRAAKADAAPRFIDAPPMTLDDQLDFKTAQLPAGVPLVASTFDNMTSGTVGLALRLNVVPEDELVYLSMMPALLTRVGVVKEGKPISFEEMTEMERREILSLNASFSANLRTGRDELIVRGSGNDVAETQRAVGWMKLALFAPNWRMENIARIRDLVEQQLSGLRNTTQGPEESWVQNPAGAYRRQDNPLLLTTSSFLTQAHNVDRLRWMLKGASDENTRAAISGFLSKLGQAGANASREDLKALVQAMQGNKSAGDALPAALKPYAEEYARLPEGALSLAGDVAKDLEQLLPDLPDASLPADWSYLTSEIRHDLSISPEQTLANLNRVRERLLKTGAARMFVIGSRSTQSAIAGNINDLLAGLAKEQPAAVAYSNARTVDARLRERVTDANAPVFVGLLSPNMQGGVFINSAPLVTYKDTDRESLLRFLSAKLYGGGGAHGIFTKTISAGLAYSNGLGSSPTNGRLQYYAERTPALPQTLSFVIGELKKSPHDPGLVEYAIAQAFGEFRAGSPYETRGEAMAADLSDGVTPEAVRNFRQAILALRHEPNLAAELYKRMDQVYATVLPGYGVKGSQVAGAVYFVIGPEKQLGAYEQYLRTAEGSDAKLYRLYPRDFWITLKEK
jgi:Zn-dependent M16 (insulinase) family peptidase